MPSGGESPAKSGLKGFGNISKKAFGFTPAGLLFKGGRALGRKVKDFVSEKEKPVLNEDGTPKLDEEGNPITEKTSDLDTMKTSIQEKFKKFAEVYKKGLGFTPAGLAVKAGLALKDKIKGAITPGKSPLDGAAEALGLKKKKTNNELLNDIYTILSSGIIVFPSELNDKNAPSHLKETLKKGKFQNAFGENAMTGGGMGTSEPKSLFSRGKEALTNAINWAKDTAGSMINRITGNGGGSGTQSSYSQESSGSGYQTQTTTNGVSAQNVNYDLPKKINDPNQASLLFYQNAEDVTKQVESMIGNGEYEKLEELAAKLEDPGMMGQNKDVNNLSPEFGSRVNNFINSPEAQAKGISVREAKRSPLTQLAYFMSGRAKNKEAIHKMYKRAGFKNGAWNTDNKVTQTMGSDHFMGNAVDIEDHGKGISYYKEIAPIAKKYGLAWGGDWKSFQDYPHFELPKNDNDIGYKGPPEQAEVSEGATQRADGYGSRGLNYADIVKRTMDSVQNKMTDRMGTTTASTVNLSESPIVTSDKMLIKQIENAINIQKSIYDEQKRHNNVAENFFTSLVSLIQAMASNNNNSQGGGLTENQIREMNSLSQIMEQERATKSRFSNTARQLAEGF
jgi:hypothetical protein